MSSHPISPPEITFVIPEFMTGVGGIEMLVLNLSRAIAESEDRTLRGRVICPRGSFVHDELCVLDSERISLCHWGENPTTGGTASLLVCWGGLGSLVKLRGNNPKILVWTVMPGQLFAHLDRVEASIPISGIYFRHLRKRIARYISETSGVVHMDRPNKIAFEEATELRTDDNYLPIPVWVRANQFLQGQAITGPLVPLRVSWVGRAGAPWKVIPLVRFLEDAVMPDHGGIQLTVFTDDAEPYRTLFETRDISKDIGISYQIGVVGDALRDRLGQDFHLHLAMGTGVLEGAAVGTPSVCINPQSDIRLRASWQWLHDKTGHDLGDFYPPESTRTPFDFDTLARDPRQLEHHSRLSHRHVLLNHEIKSILSKLLSCRTTANLQGYLHVHGLLGFLYRISQGGVELLRNHSSRTDDL